MGLAEEYQTKSISVTQSTDKYLFIALLFDLEGVSEVALFKPVFPDAVLDISLSKDKIWLQKPDNGEIPKQIIKIYMVGVIILVTQIDLKGKNQFNLMSGFRENHSQCSSQ